MWMEWLKEGECEAAVTPQGEELVLEEWRMKDAEDESRFRLMDRVVAYAMAHRCTRVRAEWRGSEELREFLAQFGFTAMGGDEESALWVLPVAAYEPMAG